MGLLITAFITAALFFGAAAPARSEVPIIFVHGNGDDATKWVPVIWLFESNGYPANRLFAIRLTDPVARRADHQPEAFRSSTTDQASELSAFVTRVLLETKAKKVVLVGSSRGGLTIRNYVKNAGGAAVVSHAVLCGTPNHGVMATQANLDSEFNANGEFLRQLNEGPEIVEGVQFLTLRSDKLDKFAQDTGYEAPELKGAENIVLPGLDHREVAFHPAAFAKMYRFLTNHDPKQLRPATMDAPVISGVATFSAGLAPTNRPLAGLRFRVFALSDGSAERDGEAMLDVITGASGEWGPLTVQPKRSYEFSLEKDGRTVSYFMSGIVRSTTLLNFRFLSESTMRAAGGTTPAGPQLLIHRPQGYLAEGRDPVTMDGQPVIGIQSGIPTRDSVLVSVPESKSSGVRIELRDERIYARPAEGDKALHVAEFLWE